MRRITCAMRFTGQKTLGTEPDAAPPDNQFKILSVR